MEIIPFFLVALLSALGAFAGEYKPVPLSEQNLPDADQLGLDCRYFDDQGNRVYGKILSCNDEGLKQCLQRKADEGATGIAAAVAASYYTSGTTLAVAALGYGGAAIRCVIENCKTGCDD
jgi:hypothetical protein